MESIQTGAVFIGCNFLGIALGKYLPHLVTENEKDLLNWAWNNIKFLLLTKVIASICPEHFYEVGMRAYIWIVWFLNVFPFIEAYIGAIGVIFLVLIFKADEKNCNGLLYNLLITVYIFFILVLQCAYNLPQGMNIISIILLILSIILLTYWIKHKYPTFALTYREFLCILWLILSTFIMSNYFGNKILWAVFLQILLISSSFSLKLFILFYYSCRLLEITEEIMLKNGFEVIKLYIKKIVILIGTIIFITLEKLWFRRLFPYGYYLIEWYIECISIGALIGFSFIRPKLNLETMAISMIPSISIVWIIMSLVY
ncbi:hypothetical protein SteCoe_5270 [Stentor coeruleus]|uniref:Uncharacterized protein n=1 Tax=Stentor coeruleus TaxID=5963 RepID=A0A1R2CSV5_9CILI|nr:hypothetical protein SteCoe_5270 [Stentor coeruleus]